MRFFDREYPAAPGSAFYELGDRFLNGGVWGGDNRFRFGDIDGVAFFPTIEPYFLITFFAAAVLYLLWYLLKLIR
jgi:hypothetical protein